MDKKQQIIEYIRRNRISTTEVADCLGKCGAIKGVMPINGGHFRVGEVKWVYAYEESNWPIHEQLADVEEGKVIFVQEFECNDRALFGELVSKYLLLYKQAQAIVVEGYMRDAGAIKKENYAVWCKGVTPVGCFNRKPETSFDEETIKANRDKYDGAVAVCDDCGVVVIPKENLDDQMLNLLEKIELQEDIWFDRLDRYKENTFDIVCMKKYLDSEE